MEVGATQTGHRIGAGILAVALLIAAGFMIVVMIDIGPNPPCDAVFAGEEQLPLDHNCFDGSSGAKTTSLLTGWLSGIIGLVALGVSVYYVFKARGMRLVLILTGVAIVLGAISIALGALPMVELYGPDLPTGPP